jgi:hypothetical protein
MNVKLELEMAMFKAKERKKMKNIYILSTTVLVVEKQPSTSP